MAQTHIGAMKGVARKIGITLAELQHKISIGLKWCYLCGEWKALDNFCLDRSRYDGRASLCRICRSSEEHRRYIPHPEGKRGPDPLPRRSGDKKQARRRINVLVNSGKIPDPNDIPCFDCGHTWQVGERRHEYDHYLGYGAEHHLDVQSVCTTCHMKRTIDRGESKKRNRNALGKYEGK